MRVAVVTGTSTGIGLSVAVLLAKADFRVVATMRDTSKSTALLDRLNTEGLSDRVTVRSLDVSSATSVESCIASVLQDYGRIDVLLNNAGCGFLGGLEDTDDETLARVMDVNFTGVWRVTKAVLPSMRAARSGHIIAVTSIGGLVGQPFNDAYCAAKFAVEGFLESLAPVVQRFGVRISLIEPGPVSTEFVNTATKARDDVQPTEIADYENMLSSYIAGTRAAYSSMAQSGDDVAKVIIDAALSDSPHLRYQTSPMIAAVTAKKYVDPSGDSVLLLNGARLPAVPPRDDQ